MAGLTEQDIAALELELGCTLPADVRAKYREADGYLGPTDCSFLYPYRAAADTGVVSYNASLKGEDWFPKTLAGVTILGDDGCGNQLCYDSRQQVAILWNPEDGDWVQATFPSMTELWAHIRKFYEENS